MPMHKDHMTPKGKGMPPKGMPPKKMPKGHPPKKGK